MAVCLRQIVPDAERVGERTNERTIFFIKGGRGGGGGGERGVARLPVCS